MNNSVHQVIRNHNFRNLWYSQVISQVGLNMLVFILGIEVYRMTRSNAAVSLIMLTFGVPAVIFGILAGSVVDFFDKRKVMFFCNISRGIILLPLFFLPDNLIFVYILTALLSSITQLFVPSEAPSIPQLVEKENVLAANSLFTISFYMSTILGTVSAGILLKVTNDPTLAYLVISLMMFFASYFTYKLPRLTGSKQEFKFGLDFATAVKPVYEGLSYIKNSVRIRRSLYLLTCSQAIVATLGVLAPGFADKILGIELKDASFFVMGPAALGLIAGAYFVGIFGHKVLKGSVIFFGLFTAGFMLVLLSFVTFLGGNYVILSAMVLLLFLGVANSFINVPSSTILQQESEKQFRGRVYGVMTSATGGISLIPVIFSGMLADVVGVGRTIFIVGCIIILATSIYFYKRKKLLYYIEEA